MKGFCSHWGNSWASGNKCGQSCAAACLCSLFQAWFEIVCNGVILAQVFLVLLGARGFPWLCLGCSSWYQQVVGVKGIIQYSSELLSLAAHPYEEQQQSCDSGWVVPFQYALRRKYAWCEIKSEPWTHCTGFISRDFIKANMGSSWRSFKWAQHRWETIV